MLNALFLYSAFPSSTNMPKALYNHYYPRQTNISNQKPSQPPGRHTSRAATKALEA